jgi:hypothetical protein
MALVLAAKDPTHHQVNATDLVIQKKQGSSKMTA